MIDGNAWRCKRGFLRFINPGFGAITVAPYSHTQGPLRFIGSYSKLLTETNNLSSSCSHSSVLLLDVFILALAKGRPFLMPKA